jgi:DNA mismatch endonuclease (patch repair protein)
MQNKSKKISSTTRKIKVLKFKKELGFSTTAERSALMSKIRSTETKPEQLLRKELWKVGVRYRINVKALPGSPDIVVRKKKLVVFVDGEFWHGYNWAIKRKKIKTNRKFWIPKIERNMQRDLENTGALKKLGFRVLRFWEHEIKKDSNKCIKKIMTVIKKQMLVLRQAQ